MPIESHRVEELPGDPILDPRIPSPTMTCSQHLIQARLRAQRIEARIGRTDRRSVSEMFDDVQKLYYHLNRVTCCK